MIGSAMSAAAAGVLLALAAYGQWGLLPLYWKALAGVAAPVILSHRIVWSVAFLAALSLLRRDRAAFDWSRRTLGWLALSGTLLAGNWLLYIWSVNDGRVLETSLGYFINPLVSMLLGRLVLGERLRPWQKAAVALAALGVAVPVLGGGGLPWIALTLAVSFALYGLLRKLRPVDPVLGLAVETGLLLPLAAGYLWWQPGPVFGATGLDAALLLGAGVATSVPLICFAGAARRLRLTTLGFLQYLAPSMHFLLAVAVFGETVTPMALITFGCIWTALAVYAADGVRNARSAG